MGVDQLLADCFFRLFDAAPDMPVTFPQAGSSLLDGTGLFDGLKNLAQSVSEDVLLPSSSQTLPWAEEQALQSC